MRNQSVRRKNICQISVRKDHLFLQKYADVLFLICDMFGNCIILKLRAWCQWMWVRTSQKHRIILCQVVGFKIAYPLKKYRKNRKQSFEIYDTYFKKMFISINSPSDFFLHYNTSFYLKHFFLITNLFILRSER